MSAEECRKTGAHKWLQVFSVTPAWRCDECGKLTDINPHSICMTTRADIEPLNKEKRGKI